MPNKNQTPQYEEKEGKPTADECTITPVDAAADLGIDDPQHTDFDNSSGNVYNTPEVQKDDDSTPFKKRLDKETEDRKRLADFAARGDIQKVRKLLEDVEFWGIPKWEERLRSDKRDSFQWIRDHFGSSSGDQWHPGGLTRAKLRLADFKLYQAFNTRVSRLQKAEKPVPKDMRPLLETVTETVDEQLKREGIETADDIRRLYPDNPREAERLRSALRRRSP